MEVVSLKKLKKKKLWINLVNSLTVKIFFILIIGLDYTMSHECLICN